MAFGDNQYGRFKTWSIAAFLMGLLVSPPYVSPVQTMFLSLLTGIGCALAAMLAAAVANVTLGRTSSALPFRGGDPAGDVLFAITFIVAAIAKLTGHWSALIAIVGMVPSIIIFRGGIARTSENARYEMIARLQAIADDPTTPSAQREAALARLDAFDRL